MTEPARHSIRDLLTTGPLWMRVLVAVVLAAAGALGYHCSCPPSGSPVPVPSPTTPEK